MDKLTRERVEAAGWRLGDAVEFLGLTEEERAFVELKLALAGYLKELRCAKGLTQAGLARLLGSSQSRVAQMEAADVTVSVDLLVRSLLTLGASRSDVARAITRAA